MWYYALDGEQHGPIEKEDVQRMVEEGALDMDDLVWTGGMDDWKEVSNVEDLHPSPPPLPKTEKTEARETQSLPHTPDSSKTGQNRRTGTPDSERGVDKPFSSAANRREGSASDAKKIPASGNKSNSRKNGDYAGFGTRLVAHIIDVGVLVVFSILIGAFAIGIGDATLRDLQEVYRPFGFLIAWMYFALNESSRNQATMGKQIMGVKVTDMSGRKISFWKATGRHFGKILSGLILLVGFVMAAFTEKKQTLHDIMAGCLVVEDS